MRISRVASVLAILGESMRAMNEEPIKDITGENRERSNHIGSVSSIARIIPINNSDIVPRQNNIKGITL